MDVVVSFALMVIAISASGVMSPGPLFTANIVYGLKEGRNAGLKMALGHTIVELPLIILLGIGTIFISLLYYTFETLLFFGLLYLISIPISFFMYRNRNKKENLETSEEEHEDVL